MCLHLNHLVKTDFSCKNYKELQFVSKQQVIGYQTVNWDGSFQS